MTSSQAERLRLKLPVPTEDGDTKTAVLEVNPRLPVHENAEFLKGLTLMIAVSAGKKKLSKLEKWMLVEACEKHQVMPKEAYQAFWKAYGDPYVGKEGIQFRHLWKHIEKSRYGENGRLYTYEQMLDYCDDHHCSTDNFVMVEDQKDSEGRPKWALK